MEEKMKFFNAKPGTIDRGKDYECLIVANLILKLIANRDVTNFNLSLNNEAGGSFDDVILKVLFHEEKEEIYYFQLKHVDDKKKLTKSKLMAQKGDFSLTRYCESMQEFTNIKLILFTNYIFNYPNNYEMERYDKVKIRTSQTSYERMLNTDGNPEGRSYTFSIDQSETETQLNIKYKKFFAQFSLYANQQHVDALGADVSKTFVRMFCCHENDYLKFLSFIITWSNRKGTKIELDKKLISRVLAIHLLSPVIEPFSFSNASVNVQTGLLREAMFEFNTTIFEKGNYERIKQIYEDIKSEMPDINEINRIGVTYQVMKNQINNSDEVNDEDSTKILWLSGKSPLIVSENETTLKVINLCKSEKFILLSTDSSKVNFTNSKIFRNLSDLKPKAQIYKQVLESFRLSLQGKESITLESFAVDCGELGTIITTNELLKMLDCSFTIGEKEILPTPHIDRLVSNNIIDNTFLTQVKKETLIVISCQGKFDEIKTQIANFNVIRVRDFIDDPQCSTSISDREKNIYISQDVCSKLEFDEVCKKNEDRKKCHHFHVVDDKNLEWIRSKGGVTDLEEYRRKGHFAEETKLFGFGTDNNIEIVCADGGMGKSTLAKNIKNRILSTFWTVLIDVTEYSSYFEKNNQDVNDFIEDILKKTPENKNSFYFKLLTFLEEQCRLVFIWDGLDKLLDTNLKRDEILDEGLQSVMAIIDELSKRGFKQLITSRDNLNKTLENRFGVLSRTIKPFNELEQNNYIKSRLKSQAEVENVITKINKIIGIIRNNNDILGIPLSIFRLTELFIHDQEKKETLLDDVFSITHLYEYFADETFKVYFRDVAKFDITNDKQQKFLKSYRETQEKFYEQAALISCFDNKTLEELKVKREEVLKKIEEEGDCFGIITGLTRTRVPKFFHKIYAEYFAATYLYKNCKEIPKLKEFIFDEKYRNIRFLFDLFLSVNCPMYIAVLHKNNSKLLNNEIQNNDKDEGERNLLQVMSSWGERYPLLETQKNEETWVIIDDTEGNSVEENNTEYKKMLELLSKQYDPYEVDELFKLDAFCYADKSLCLLPIIITLLNSPKVKVNNFENLNIRNFKDKITVLYYSAKFDYSVVFELIKEIPFIETKIKKQSLLHISAKYNSKNCLSKMLSTEIFKRRINDRDIDGQTPIFIACLYGHTEIVRILTKHEADVNIVNNDGSTPLFAAQKNAHAETVELLKTLQPTLNK